MTQATDSFRSRLGRWLAEVLQRESSGYRPYTPSDPQTLYRSLEPGHTTKLESRSIPYNKGLSTVIAILILTSVGVIAQASVLVTENANASLVGYALFVSVLSVLISIVMFFFSVETLGGPKPFFGLSLVLLGLWTSSIVFTTFSVPFVVNGFVLANGFYSTWVLYISMAYSSIRARSWSKKFSTPGCRRSSVW